VLCVPLVPLVPVQPPVAVHEVAFVELHVSVDVPPPAIAVGAALRDAVGFGSLIGGFLLPELHAATSSEAATRTLRTRSRR
jgi:hypothetical protein